MTDRAQNFITGSGFQNSDLINAKACCNADILNKEFEVGTVLVVIIPPCRITISVKTFISYGKCIILIAADFIFFHHISGLPKMYCTKCTKLITLV